MILAYEYYSICLHCIQLYCVSLKKWQLCYLIILIYSRENAVSKVTFDLSVGWLFRIEQKVGYFE